MSAPANDLARQLALPERTSNDETVWFYPNHVLKLVAFGLVGGFPFFMYWAYRSWRAYVANWGYAREPFWRRVRAATRYRPSAIWRALMCEFYFLCLFPAVDRECRLRGLRGIRAAELWAVAFIFLHFAQDRAQGLLTKGLLSPVWMLVPVQLAVNRLHRSEGRRVRFTTNGSELVWMVLGAWLLFRGRA